MAGTVNALLERKWGVTLSRGLEDDWVLWGLTQAEANRWARDLRRDAQVLVGRGLLPRIPRYTAAFHGNRPRPERL